jgi:hypothetical protein
VADILMKALPRLRFEKLHDALGIQAWSCGGVTEYKDRECCMFVFLCITIFNLSSNHLLNILNSIHLGVCLAHQDVHTNLIFQYSIYWEFTYLAYSCYLGTALLVASV